MITATFLLVSWWCFLPWISFNTMNTIFHLCLCFSSGCNVKTISTQLQCNTYITKRKEKKTLSQLTLMVSRHSGGFVLFPQACFYPNIIKVLAALKNYWPKHWIAACLSRNNGYVVFTLDNPQTLLCTVFAGTVFCFFQLIPMSITNNGDLKTLGGKKCICMVKHH